MKSTYNTIVKACTFIFSDPKILVKSVALIFSSKAVKLVM